MQTYLHKILEMRNKGFEMQNDVVIVSKLGYIVPVLMEQFMFMHKV